MYGIAINFRLNIKLVLKLDLSGRTFSQYSHSKCHLSWQNISTRRYVNIVKFDRDKNQDQEAGFSVSTKILILSTKSFVNSKEYRTRVINLGSRRYSKIHPQVRVIILLTNSSFVNVFNMLACVISLDFIIFFFFSDSLLLRKKRNFYRASITQ